MTWTTYTQAHRTLGAGARTFPSVAGRLSPHYEADTMAILIEWGSRHYKAKKPKGTANRCPESCCWLCAFTTTKAVMRMRLRLCSVRAYPQPIGMLTPMWRPRGSFSVDKRFTITLTPSHINSVTFSLLVPRHVLPTTL